MIILRCDKEAAAKALGYTSVEDAEDYRNTGRQDTEYRNMCQDFANYRIEVETRITEWLRNGANYEGWKQGLTLIHAADAIKGGVHRD